MQTGDIDLLNHQHIHLQLAIHRLEQFRFEGLRLEIGGIIPMVQICLEIVERAHATAYLARDRSMTLHEFLQRIGLEAQACLQVQVLAERETTQVIGIGNILEVVILLVDRHDGRSAEDDMQSFEAIIAALEFARPVRIFKELIQEQIASAFLHKLTCQIQERVLREIEVIEVYIETRTHLRERFSLFSSSFDYGFRCVFPLGFDFFDARKEKIRFSYSSSTLDSNEAVVPIDFIHQLPADRHEGMSHQEIVDSKECV